MSIETVSTSGLSRGPFHDMSHGESFFELAVDRFRGPGLRVLDEPESALFFHGRLNLLAVLKHLLAAGNSQVIISTHSPVLRSGVCGPLSVRFRLKRTMHAITSPLIRDHR